MSSTATLKGLTTDNDGQIYFAQIKGEAETIKSGNASVSLLRKLIYNVRFFVQPMPNFMQNWTGDFQIISFGRWTIKA